MSEKPTYEELEQRVRDLEKEASDRISFEEALRESEEKFRSLAENSHDYIMRYDEQCRHLYQNAAGYKVSGFSEEEFIGKTHRELGFDEHLSNMCEDGIKRVFKSGEPTGEVFEWESVEGSVFLDWRLYPEFDQDGKVKTVLGVSRDITEFKQAEEALREGENIFGLFLEHSPIYVFFKDKNIRSIRLSKNYEHMLGRSIDELLGKTMDELFPSDLAKSMIADDLRILNEGIPVSIEEEFHGRFYETTKFPILINGKPKYLAGYTVDITERKQAEKALIESEKKYRSVIEDANIGITVIQDGQRVFFNSIMHDMLGYTREEYSQIDFLSVIHPEDRSFAVDRIGQREAVVSMDPGIVEIKVLSKSGETKWIEMNSAEIQWEGRPAVQAFVFDISKRKRAEEALRESEERFRHLFEGSIQGILIHKKLKPVFVNQAFAETHGYSVEDILSMETILPLLGSHERSRLMGYMESRLGGEKAPIQYEYQGVRKDGSLIWLENRVKIMELWGESAIQMTIFDITERKQADEALREGEERYRSLFNNMDSGVAIYQGVNNGDDFIFVDFNKTGEKIDHVQRNELIGKSILEKFPGVKDFGLFDVFQRVWKTGQPEHHPISMYKDERITGWRDNFVYKLPSGEIVAIYSDETERKQAAEALREKDARYKLLLDASVAGFNLIDKDGNYLLINKKTAKIWGKTPEDIVNPIVA